MWGRSPRIASLLFVVAAIAVGYALGAGRIEPAGEPAVSGEQTAAAGRSADAKTAHMRRGPRGPRGRRGPQGPRGPRGPEGARGGDAITDLTINWRNGAWEGRQGAEATVTGVATLGASCRPITGNENGEHRLVVTPSNNGVRTVVNVTVFQGAGTQGAATNNRYTSDGPGSPIVVDLPVNGMFTAVLSIEPIGGDGGAGPAPWSLQASSEMKLNGPGGDGSTENFCYVALQAARGE